jgi:hypothetical protein
MTVNRAYEGLNPALRVRHGEWIFRKSVVLSRPTLDYLCIKTQCNVLIYHPKFIKAYCGSI